MTSARSEATLRQVDRLLAQGQPEAAAALAGQAVQAGSTRMLLHFRLAAAGLKIGQYRKARDAILAASRLAPQAPGELVELAQRLLYFNQSEAMRRVAARLLSTPVWHAAAEADFAAMLSMMGEQSMAARLLDRAIAVTGANPGQLYNRSQMHLYSGRMAEAERDLRQSLVLEPRMAKAHWALSKLPLAAATEQELATMRQLASTQAADTQDEAFLRFALFNRLDRLNRDDLAWAELSRGCQVKRRLVSYDTAATATLFNSLERAFRVGDVLPAAPDAMDSPTPVFIVGMHRSGTTLLERILGNHSQVSEGGELYDFPAQLRLALGRHFNGPCDIDVVENMSRIDFSEVGPGYLQQVSWRAGGKRFLVDKLPSNFLNIGFIRQALPQAKLIHMRRNAMDTCYSNLKELFSNACAYSYDQLELADYYAMYRRMMAHWHAVAPGFILDVSYEELARDPQTQAARILAFCGLDWEDGCLDMGGNERAVNTASSAQVREPIHQRGIQAWRRHEAHLAPLAARLAEHGID